MDKGFDIGQMLFRQTCGIEQALFKLFNNLAIKLSRLLFERAQLFIALLAVCFLQKLQ